MAIANVSFNGNGISKTTKKIVLGPEVKRYIQEQASQKELLDSMSKPVKALNKMKNLLGGESTNIIINALGTGLIAPIFIKYNFLSKTDSDTRTYSAWRQPVSALLSVVTQVGVLIPINRYMNKLSNEGKLFGFNMLNQGGLQNKDYLTSKIKKENPKLSKEAVAKKVETAQNEQLQKLVDSINDKNTISFKDSTGKEVSLSKNEFKELVNGILDEKETKYKGEISNLKGDELKAKTKTALYKFKNEKEVREFLTEAQKNTKTAGKNTEELQKWFATTAKQMQGNGKDEELVTLANNISKRPTVETISNKIEKELKKLDTYKALGSKEKVQAYIKENIGKSVKEAEDKIKSIKTVRADVKSGKSLKTALSKLAEGQPLKESMVMDVVQKYAGNVQKNMKGWGALSGLAISFAMLPVSCMLLNDLYPKFMNVFFPNLSKAKPKPQENNGDKLELSAKSEEVNK